MNILISRSIIGLCLFFLSLCSYAYAEDIRDVKGPLEVPPNYTLLIVVSVLCVLILGFVIYTIVKTKASQTAVIENPKLPWEIAFEQLEALANDDLLSKGMLNQYYSRLSNIVRRYFEDQFLIRAPEMTTEEFMEFLKGYHKLNDVQKDALKKFLTSADMVKFAKYAPAADESHKSLQLAKSLIEETKDT